MTDEVPKIPSTDLTAAEKWAMLPKNHRVQWLKRANIITGKGHENMDWHKIPIIVQALLAARK